ncbi:pyruvate, phosphate dikinase [Helicovermis profundi]|uniref:Pyruvate, phosphate dikinase n=1 Tax=Helicovermis profundi TaxID=3065157 RepID=A0AAU9ET91_9FIRM|nr:pyruvate, phosphate dikinase [Clostridia bacterium S502]
MKKYLYAFEEGSKELKKILGGKGANLAEMKKIGLPVPNGYTITAEACIKYYDDGEKIDEKLIKGIFERLKELEGKTGKIFGDNKNPLLVSVRSGAAISMPGMMDTILNLGLNDNSVIGVSELTNNPRFAYDSYRRFIQMFSDVVLNISKHKFDSILDSVKERENLSSDPELSVDNLKEIIEKYKKLVKKETKIDFPVDPNKQLIMAIESVFESWNNSRAIIYRNINEIPHDMGTAVNIQEMVFGNMGDTSGTGVAFTRNPATGENKFFGEFLLNAQGEDVVAGIRTPKEINELENVLPEVYNDFSTISRKLEKHYRDMQDIEFTIERGKLYFLQTRTAKRTANAAINIAVDMVEEGMITKEEAILRINPDQIEQLLHPTFDDAALKESQIIAKGLPASPGAATGKVYFTSEDVVEAKARGEKAILVRVETSPEDIEGMVSGEGILTARGGMTSHAAVVARGMGKCCVAGCGDVRVETYNSLFKTANAVVNEGEYISIDGNTGNVYKGEIKTKEVAMSGNFGTLMSWADDIRRLNIRTNADNERDSKTAIKFGAEGIGLCRTEHMFFNEERIFAVRQMIVSTTIEQRKIALKKLLPYQKDDFVSIFNVMKELPVTIRLLDPPLHEFLPSEDEDIKNLALELGMEFNNLKSIVNELREFNPMLGHRGVRLAVTYPEIYEMQVKAIMLAAVEVKKKNGYDIKPEIMVPLVGFNKEFTIIKKLIRETADEILKEENMEMTYKIGTMIEVPRAALTADEIAKEAEFFSFGTNDLTQMTLGFSRDDSGKFIPEYKKKEIFESDPFETIDQDGVGQLIKIAFEKGKKVRPDIKIGICGEHGGEPKSIEFCDKVGLKYVSCSPYRVPVARLAAAQATIKNKK